MDAQALEGGRARALAAVEKAEKVYKGAFFGALAVEAALLAALLLLVDLRDPLHKMVAVGFVGSYSIVLLAIVALGAHVSRIGQRILRAIELTK